MATAVNAHHPEVAKAHQAGIRPAIWIVACGKAKRSLVSRARDLYTGHLTSLQIRFATTRGGVFGGTAAAMIASARYGLVDMDTEVAPYDVTLNDFTADQLALWAQLVAAQAAERGIAGATVYVMGGARYTDALAAAGFVVTNFDTPAGNPWLTRAKFMGERKASLTRLLAA